MRKIYSLLLTLTMVLAANAQTVAPKVAAQKAVSVFTKSNAAKGAVVSAADPQLAYVSVLEGDTCFYVFNNPQGGYAIIGGDLASRDVLAVVDNGSFNLNRLSPQTVGWLNQYAKQIRAAKKAGLHAPALEEQNQSVEPLCPAKWGQDDPYHNFTPLLPDLPYFQDFDGESYVGTHAATGCVATATAQVLYTLYKVGKPMPAHVTEDIVKTLAICNENDDTLTFTESLTYSKDRTIDWSILKDSYSEGDTDASAVEVGQLMYLMGLISDMGYGVSSGAGTIRLQEGLQKYLGMTEADYLAKFDEDGNQDVDDEEWESTVYYELIESRPVIFTGNAKDGGGGHCFLCDGYNAENNLFHINWGWDSLGDGYFALSAASQTNNGQGEGSMLRPQTGDPQTGSSSTNDFGYGSEIVYNLIYNGSDPYTATAIKTVNTDATKTVTAQKFLDNGQLVIIKNGVKYNSVGQKI